MDIVNSIKLKDFRESKNDKIIINYINENPDECLNKSISKIANDLFISESTITRFTRKLGFTGFQEFKLNLAKYLVKDSNKSRVNIKVNLNESVTETANKLFDINKKSIEKSLKLIDSSNIVKIKDLILGASRLFFFGIGNSGLVAMHAGYKFMRIGFDVNYTAESHVMIMLASLMRRGDVLFLISHSGETAELLKVIQIAKKNKVKVVSITEYSNNSLEKLSDYNIGYISPETIFETKSVLSKFTQLFFVELLYAEVIKENYDEFNAAKEKTTEALFS